MLCENNLYTYTKVFARKRKIIEKSKYELSFNRPIKETSYRKLIIAVSFLYHEFVYILKYLKILFVNK